MVRLLREIHRTLIRLNIGEVCPATLFLEFFAARPHLFARAGGFSPAAQFRIPVVAAGTATPPGCRYSFGVYL